MRSSAISHGLPAFTAEHIFNYVQETRHVPLNDKARLAIQAALTSRQELITLNILIGKLNEAKETINLLHGLTSEQKAELRKLISREKEFKFRHRQRIAQHDDYKQFIVEQYKILPLQQLITWWDNNHESFMKDEFWEKTTLAAKAQSAKRKESEKRKRKRLHHLLDVREDFKHYESYYGFTGEDLLHFNTSFLDYLAELIQQLLKKRRTYPVMIAEYLSVILRSIENEKKLIIYSMIYRLQCAEYYKDKTCDDLMTYTCDRIYQYTSLQKDDKKIQPPKRCGLTPALSEAFKQHILAYAKSHPDDRLVRHKIKDIEYLSAPSDQTAAPVALPAVANNTAKQNTNTPANTNHLTPDLGRLILAIEDVNHLLANPTTLTAENITAFFAKFNDDILNPVDKILLSINQTLTFPHLMQFKLILDYCLQPCLKMLILSANQVELDTHPYWYHLSNHFGSRKDISALPNLISSQETSASFNHMLEFATHFTKTKHRLNQAIQSHLLQESGLGAKLPLSNDSKLTRLLGTDDVNNNDLLTLWTTCAKKLKLNHVIQHYDLVYAVNLLKYLTKISNEILRRAANDPALCHQAIKSFAILNEVKQDLDKCLQQEARTNRFHYLFNGRINQESLLKPLIQPLDKIYLLDLTNKLDDYIKDYARYEKKRAILMALRAKCAEAIDNKCSPLTVIENFNSALNDVNEDKYFAASCRFKRRLGNLFTLSKQYFAPVNERTFSSHTLKMCSLLS